jgi:hypothetical protein
MLTVERLHVAVGNDAAIRRIQRLQPVGGPGDKIFPPTYPGERTNDAARHLFETRRINGGDVRCVLIDSVQSQANLTDRDESSGTGVDVKLFDHLANVEAKAQAFARAAGLNDRLTKLVALAARLHDLGRLTHDFRPICAGRMRCYRATPRLHHSCNPTGRRLPKASAWAFTAARGRRLNASVTRPCPWRWPLSTLT